ncbi:MAG: hypothetical protein ACFE9M_13125 [Promethearchaeota archaeon]
MESGKITSLVAGIITIVATYVFSWYAMIIGGPIPLYRSNGLGIITNLPDLFINADIYGPLLGMPGFAVYIVASFLIFFFGFWYYTNNWDKKSSCGNCRFYYADCNSYSITI